MKRAVAAGLFLLSFSVFGQYPYGDRRDRGGYDRSDRYRDPRNGRGSIVSQVISDLDQVNYRSWRGRERNNANDARNNLLNFQSTWQRGRFETKYLDRAIDHMKAIAGYGRIDPRMRERMARDIDELRAFRASGGYR